MRVAALDQIGVVAGCGWVGVGHLGDWGGWLLGFCGWWLWVCGDGEWWADCEGDQMKRE